MVPSNKNSVEESKFIHGGAVLEKEIERNFAFGSNFALHGNEAKKAECVSKNKKIPH